ncbi:phage minor capsid protein [Weissella paramesenteroides]
MAKVNDDQMLLGASVVGDIYSNMAQELFIRMIRRIKKRGVADLKDNPYLWQLEKLNDMHMLNEENIAYVAKQTGVARKLIDEIIQNEGLKVYQNTAEQIADDLNTTTPSYNSVQETLANYAQQTFLDIDNLVNQTLLTTNMSDNATMRVYQKIIEQSVAEVTTGLKSPDKAVSDTVMKWIDKGIPSGFIDKGGHTWSIERYADTVMQSTTYRVYNEMRTSAADELGVDTFLMSSHAASRPACAPIQGHVVTKQVDGFNSHDKDVGYVASIYDHGYGEPGGTLGINCHHTLTPFIIGVNRLPDVNIPDPKHAIANGKKQASQRSFERGIREAKYKLEAAKQLGDDKLIQHYQSLLSKRRLGLRKLIDNNDFLHRDYSRERIYKNQKLIDNYKMNLLRKPAPKPVSKPKPVVNDIPLINKVNSLNGISKDNLHDIQSIIDGTSENIKKLIKQFSNGEIKETNRTSHYNVADNTLYLQRGVYTNDVSSRKSIANSAIAEKDYGTIFHELGHKIDFEAADGVELSMQANLASSAKREYKKLAKSSGFDNFVNTITFTQEIHNTEGWGGFSDVILGSSSGEINAGSGHYNKKGMIDKKYYSKRLGTEIFANLFEATVTKSESRKLFEKYLPQTTAKFDKILEGYYEQE